MVVGVLVAEVVVVVVVVVVEVVVVVVVVPVWSPWWHLRTGGCTCALRETCLSVSLTLSFSLLLNTINNTTHYTKKDKQSKAEHSTKPIVFQDGSKMVRPIHETSSKKKETQPHTQQTTHSTTHFSLCGDLQCCSLVSKGPQHVHGHCPQHWSVRGCSSWTCTFCCCSSSTDFSISIR